MKLPARDKVLCTIVLHITIFGSICSVASKLIRLVSWFVGCKIFQNNYIADAQIQNVLFVLK